MSKSKQVEFNREISNWMNKQYEGRFRGRKKSNAFDGKVFAWVCLEEIYSYIWSLDKDEIENGFCDGPKDLGVDYIAKHGRDYTICQFKYRGRAGIELSDISQFFGLHKVVTNKKFVRENGNEAVIDLLDGVSDDAVFHYHLICSCDLSETQHKFVNHETLSQSSTKNITWTVSDGRKLREDKDTVTSSVDEPPLTVSFPVHGRFLDLSDCIGDDHHNTAICVVDGNTLKDIYKQHKQRLFSYNIRNYLGSNAVNRKIKETIEERPEFFYLYNNGISALATDFDYDEEKGTLLCQDFQIINGAQTVSQIGKSDEIDKLKKVSVLMKITRTKLKSVKGVRENIIKYSNSQSIIKLADFRSNDPIQLDIEKKFKEKGILWPFKNGNIKVLYARKRSYDMKSRAGIIYVDLKELAKIMYVCRYDPCRISSNPNMLFDTEGENCWYYKLFGKDGRDVDICLDTEFEKISAEVIMALFIAEKIADKVKVITDKDSIEYMTLLAKWHFLWCFSHIVNNIFQSDEDRQKFYRKVANATERDDKTIKAMEAWFNRVFNTIAEKLESIKNEKDGFNFRNWMRTFDQAKPLELSIRRHINDYVNPFEK